MRPCLQIRIVVGNDDPEIARLDGGAFLEWLQRQDDEAEQGSSSGTIPSFQPRVAVIGHNFKPIPANLEAPELSNLAKPEAVARKVAAIATPSYISIQSSGAQGTGCLYNSFPYHSKKFLFLDLSGVTSLCTSTSLANVVASQSFPIGPAKQKECAPVKLLSNG